MSLSRNQIDKLGRRLREGVASVEDLRLLDEYRRSFSEAYLEVSKKIATELSISVLGRPAKSTPSIVAKLRRIPTRLSNIQDIAGCRLILPDIAAQNAAVLRLHRLFPVLSEVDRRIKPSNGYRAYHIVVACGSQHVEIQIRTALQQWWAMEVEGLSDKIDPSIKYGGGPPEVCRWLQLASSLIQLREDAEVYSQKKGVFELIGRIDRKLADLQLRAHADPGSTTEDVEALRALVRELPEKFRASVKGGE